MRFRESGPAIGRTELIFEIQGPNSPLDYPYRVLFPVTWTVTSKNSSIFTESFITYCKIILVEHLNNGRSTFHATAWAKHIALCSSNWRNYEVSFINLRKNIWTIWYDSIIYTHEVYKNLYDKGYHAAKSVSQFFLKVRIQISHLGISSCHKLCNI